MDDPTDAEIQALFEEINTADESVQLDAADYLREYRGEALARPNAVRVALLRTLLNPKLQELIRAVHRDGMFQ